MKNLFFTLFFSFFLLSAFAQANRITLRTSAAGDKLLMVDDRPFMVNGMNAIGQYTGVPARWIQYIYEEYGIFTMLNHSFGKGASLGARISKYARPVIIPTGE